MKSILAFLIFLLLITPALALNTDSINSQGPYQQHSAITLVQTCADCTFVNITSIIAPNGIETLDQISMTQSGTKFTHNISFGNTSQIGTYYVSGFGNPEGTDTVFQFTYEVTPSGSNLTEGQGLVTIGSLIVMILLAGFFFIFSFRVNSGFGKFAFICVSAVMLLMVVLYSVVLVQQNLGGFADIIQGYETFYFVIKMVGTVAVVSLSIVALLVSIRFYRFKRGWID